MHIYTSFEQVIASAEYINFSEGKEKVVQEVHSIQDDPSINSNSERSSIDAKPDLSRIPEEDISESYFSDGPSKGDV